MRELINRLRDNHYLSAEGYRSLLIMRDHDDVNYLMDQARQVAVGRFGKGIYVRGLIELSNVCRNDCLYCGIRRSNSRVTRYTLTREQVMNCCEQGYEFGFRTLVLQGGEWGEERSQWIAEIIAEIKERWPDCAVTLSLGEHPRETYALWHEAGADRYLLRHETHNKRHYSLLHPQGMTIQHRLQCLDWLKELGYQVGAGIMVGAPFQNLKNIVEDIQFLVDFKPHMIGIGPFIPQQDTPFGRFPAGSVDMTARLYAILRLALPSALIPSTTAMATLAPDGRLRGILAGANVVMPNLSPLDNRKYYALYDNKASLGAESAQGIRLLADELATRGYFIDWSRGDYPTPLT
ncbi:MAG: [Muribaculaceae bacterium]|nr:[FeFe] hydrogenase H-cluster radical SAM maturase HydE [Muribaculaceae bacterium]